MGLSLVKICFWCILITFQQLRRTFLSAFLCYQLLKCVESTPIGQRERLKCVKSTPIGPRKRFNCVKSTPIGLHWIEALREVLSFGGLQNEISRWRCLQLSEKWLVQDLLDCTASVKNYFMQSRISKSQLVPETDWYQLDISCKKAGEVYTFVAWFIVPLTWEKKSKQLTNVAPSVTIVNIK